MLNEEANFREETFTVGESRIKFSPSLAVGSLLFGSERIEAIHPPSTKRFFVSIRYSYHLQSPRVTRVRPEVNAADLPGSCGPGYTYVFDRLAVRRILEDTAAQISAVPPTPADLCCPDPGLHP
nr:unnamed protein product [Spirometra erinaceieuropaei]